MKIPLAYQSGYKRTWALNPDLTAKYIKHTAFGDPQADALDSFDQT